MSEDGRSPSGSPRRSPRRQSVSPDRDASPARNGRSPTPPPADRERSRSRSPLRRDSPQRGRGRTPPTKEAENTGTNLYVTGLSSRVTDEDMLELFSQEGKVLEARIVVDPRTRESRGFGFVMYEDPRDADAAMKNLDNKPVKGRVIKVEKARRARARTPTPGQYRGARTARDLAPRRDRYDDRYERRYSPRRDDYRDRYDRRDDYDRRDRYERRRRSPSPRRYR